MPNDTNQNSSKGNIILNGCLTYIYSLMSSRDKSFIGAAVVSSYDFPALKKARDLLYKFSDPQCKSYNGPRNGTDADKAAHAFDSIYQKFIELDSSENLPPLACPPEELRFLPNKEQNVHQLCQLKFEKLDSEVAELKKTFHSFVSIVTSKEDPPVFEEPVNPPHNQLRRTEYRDKVLSSVSSISKKRKVNSEGDTDSVRAEDQGFVYPKQYQRKLNRMKSNTDTPSRRPSVARDHPQGKNRKPGIWGKSQSSKVSSFKGVPRELPKAFIYRCHPQATKDDVQSFLKEESIDVTEVRVVSHANATFRSFVVSVRKKEDFDKLMTGEPLPSGVGVRRYFPPRDQEPEWKLRKYQELDAISAMDEDSQSSASPGSSDSRSSDPVQATTELLSAVTAASALRMNSDSTSRSSDNV